ncbi:hypothetical protein ACFGVR_07520 [Mucilaginibacter sp. AW1-3]
MKQNIKCAFAVFAGILWLCNATAQKTTQALLSIPKAPGGVTVDGVLAEWADTSFVYNSDSKLKYIISSDDTYIYLVVNLDQKAIKQKVLGAGITLSFNTEGKKKKSYSFSYPVPVDESLNYVAKQHARMTNAKADGFKGIDGDMVLPDEHGFKAAFAFRDDGTAGYEAAIPLAALNIKPDATALNINVTVNALEKSDFGDSGGISSGTVITKMVAVPAGTRPRTNYVPRSGVGAPAGSGAPKDDGQADLYNSTNFWLNYTLPAK